MRLFIVLLVCAIPCASLATPSSANFRRGEVNKVMGKNARYLTTTMVQKTRTGLILGATSWVKETANRPGYAKFRWVKVPFDRSKKVRTIGNREARTLGLNPFRDALKEATNLSKDAKFAAGAPLKNVTFSYMTNGWGKHAGTTKSLVFSAELSKPVDGVSNISVSVPLLKNSGAESAWSY